MRLAEHHSDWVLGFLDESWWSRTARPGLHAWSEAGRPLRLVEHEVPQDDLEPKALACYGLWMPEEEACWLRFVEGRPISAVTIQFLAWCSTKLASEDKTALLLSWDQAGWHLSKIVRHWIRTHNRQVKTGTKSGVRILARLLPRKSPWLNPIEPKWLHAKRRVIEPARVLSTAELESRVYAALDCQPEPPLIMPEQAT